MSLTVALFSSFLRFLLFRGETSHKALKRGTNNQKASALPTQLANMIRKKEGLEILQQEKVARRLAEEVGRSDEGRSVFILFLR